MSIDRRALLKAGVTLSAAAALPNAAGAGTVFDPQPGAWRSFQITTRIDIADGSGKRQGWVPVPSVSEPGWFKSLGSDWTSNGHVRVARDPKYGAEMLHVVWADDENNPFVEVTSRIATRDRATDFGNRGRRRRFRRPSAHSTRKAPSSFPSMASSGRRRIRSSLTPMPQAILKRRELSTTGSWITRSEMQRCAAAVSAISPRC